MFRFSYSNCLEIHPVLSPVSYMRLLFSDWFFWLHAAFCTLHLELRSQWSTNLRSLNRDIIYVTGLCLLLHLFVGSASLSMRNRKWALFVAICSWSMFRKCGHWVGRSVGNSTSNSFAIPVAARSALVNLDKQLDLWVWSRRRRENLIYMTYRRVSYALTPPLCPTFT